MLDQVKIAFIGGGMMGEALIAGLLRQQLVKSLQLIVSEPRVERARYLADTYKIILTNDNQSAVQVADLVILAVKPQHMNLVMADIAGHIRPEALVMSIAAGVRLDTLTTGLSHSAVVRVMPNTPAQLGFGVSGWTTTSAVSARHKQQAEKVLQALGEAIFFPNEGYLDMTTAVSGSGPAYVFLFIEAFIDAAVQIGLPRPEARKMVLQTLAGALAFAQADATHPASLRDMVTSPGGTTAAALYALEKNGFRTAIIDGVVAAYQKSIALGDKPA